MKIDIKMFCQSCNVCQKIKNLNFSKYGFLILNLIPMHLYKSISMDFIIDLPWSEGYNAIFVVVDCLSKHAHFIPTNMGIDAEKFRSLFMRNVVTKFRLPSSIVADRDPQWTLSFWKSIAKPLRQEWPYHCCITHNTTSKQK